MADFECYLCLLLAFFVTNVVNVDSTSTHYDGQSEQHPARDFSRHTITKPRMYHGREKRQISSTKDVDEHLDHVTIHFPVDGEDFIIDLTLNKQLIPKGYFTKIQKEGAHKITKPEAKDVELCHYNGKVRGKSGSWVALSSCDGLSGVIFDGNEMHYIEKNRENAQDFEHYLYKHSDVTNQGNKTCGYSGGAEDHAHDHSSHNRFLRYKRAAANSEMVRGPYNANKESKYVELVLVVDNREYKELGESTTRVENHCKTIANIINGLYAPLNIFIALVGVVIWTEHDEISFSTNGDTTLTNFLHYRRKKLIEEHPNDNAQLLTKFNFDNGVVGKALKGPICTYEYSGGVNTDHSPVVGLVATTVAHEMGHNFGMEHDTIECKCEDDRCIMAPSSSSVAPTHWSSCSLNYLLLAFTHGMDYCLKNKPEALFSSPVCGNGFVEPGEQCDCGLPEHCDNTCCNATTCMLHPNASCATGECCDLQTCKPKNAGTECRSARYECDLPEYCTGQSEYCPTDIFKMDTEVCDDGKAFCYHGFCRTKTDQCKLLWGDTGKSSDEECYKMNKKGTRHGNCGYHKFNQSFSKCNDDDVLCGMLHCRHLNERLEFGMESVSILSHSFINLKGSIVPCRTAIVDLGINQVDPGLAPDGAKCGVGKMCVNQKCMSVASLQKQGGTCPNDCNGHGVCNNLGHCHCEHGFAPPFCLDPGVGGSVDSGPSSDPNAGREFTIALFVIFLGVIPLCSICAFVFYYLKQNGGRMVFKKPSSGAAYVSNSFGSSFQHVLSACKGVGGGTASKQVPTVSARVPIAARNFEIKQTGSKSPTKAIRAPYLESANHSLLPTEQPRTGGYEEFFGNFKGFSLTPLKEDKAAAAVPARAAPLPPQAPPIIKNPVVARSNTVKPPTIINKSVARAQSLRQNLSEAIANIHTTSAAPALPPPNPGSQAKPIISSPILENSTCSAKELISPLRNCPKMPTRSAPTAPPLVLPVTLELNSDKIVISNCEDVNTMKKKESTLNRIASFLKSSDRNKVTLTRSNSNVKANKIDKDALKSIEISNPIPQSQSTTMNALPVDSEQSRRAVVMRAQSMRSPNSATRPAIPTFGSMRQPNKTHKRPMSIPNGNRPKSPPPPRPPDNPEKINLPNLPGYQKPAPPVPINAEKCKKSNSQYDDCLNKAPLAKLNEISPTGSDNIYAVIEESPVSPVASPSPPESAVKTASSSNDSMGLLGEIVSEIQNRNFDSIYSTSTLARKKKEDQEKKKKLKESAELYENANVYKSPEDGSTYSNMNSKSSASSTSSGYIYPSAVNVPNKKEDIKKVEVADKRPTLSSFKSDTPATYKPYHSTFNRSQGPVASSFKSTPPAASTTKTVENPPAKIKSPPSPSASKNSVKPAVSRQITPPNLRTRRPSPTRGAPSPPNSSKTRSITNSPDLVTSCNNKPSSKPPDVLNGGPTLKSKPSITSVKPNLNGLPKAPPKIANKSVSFKQGGTSSPVDKKSPDSGKSNAKVAKSVSDVSGGVNKSNLGVRTAAKQSSNVASLQQKFETKSSTPAPAVSHLSNKSAPISKVKT